jgi:hypothetical protein
MGPKRNNLPTCALQLIRRIGRNPSPAFIRLEEKIKGLPPRFPKAFQGFFSALFFQALGFGDSGQDGEGLLEGAQIIFHPLCGLLSQYELLLVELVGHGLFRCFLLGNGFMQRYPEPTSSGTRNNYTRVGNEGDTQDQFDVRLDHRFSNQDQVFGRYSHMRDFATPVAPLPDGTPVYTRYGHVENISVHAGDVVARGQQISTVGLFGPPEGKNYHLHFDISNTTWLENHPRD